MENKKLGLLFGGLVGDAFGSRYEFKSAYEVKNELSWDYFQFDGLKGGGPFDLQAGQITDDSELALTLAHSLKESNGTYNQNLTAKYYIKWYNSRPFDIGNTIGTALHNASGLSDINKNVKNNIGSLSNGCLMRIWSLLYFYYDKPDSELAKAIIEDCKLTHPNNECVEVCILYCKILKMALKFGSKKEDIIKILIDSNKYMNSKITKSICETTLNDRDCIEVNGKFIKLNGMESIGYIGLSLSIVLKEFIKSNNDIIKFMSNICSYGGDTDTNCCIGGALFGAFYGKLSIPSKWIQQICKVKCERYTRYPKADVINFLF